MSVSSRDRPEGIAAAIDLAADWSDPPRSPSRPPAPRNRAAAAPASVPPMGDDGAERVAVLLADLARETSQLGGAILFPQSDPRPPEENASHHPPPAEMREADETLIRYRISSMAVLRQTDKEERAMFLHDLRDGERRPFPQMQLMLQISGALLAPTDVSPAQRAGSSIRRSGDSRPAGYVLGGP